MNICEFILCLVGIIGFVILALILGVTYLAFKFESEDTQKENEKLREENDYLRRKNEVIKK